MISSFFDKINPAVQRLTYERPDVRQPVTGVLLAKNGLELSVQTTETRVVKVVTREPIDQMVGERVAIEHRNIESMETKGKKAAEKPSADGLLEKLQVPVNEETHRALANLEKHGLEINRGNLMALITAGKLLDQIAGALTHDKALQLLQREIDPDRTSLQELAKMLQEVPEVKESFSFLKFLGLKKAMTLEDAEKTALTLYGQKMGRDAADAIRALDRQGVAVTRQQVDKLLAVHEKVAALKEIREGLLAETLKGNIEPSLDHLYKLHSGIQRGILQPDAFPGDKLRGYSQQTAVGNALSEQDLERMADEIRRQIRAEGLEPTPERMAAAGRFIQKGIALTGENLQRLEELKESVRLVADKLNTDRLAALQKAGIDAGKQDIAQLARWIQEHEQLQEKEKPGTVQDKEIRQWEQQLEKLAKTDEKQLLQLIKQGGELRLEQLAPAPDRGTLAGVTSEKLHSLRRLAESLQMLQTLSESAGRKESVLSLLIKKASPLTLHEVGQMDLFLQNRQQIGHLLGQMRNLLQQESAKGSEAARQTAEQLTRMVQQNGEQLKSGKGTDPVLYRETARFLKSLEPLLQQLNPAIRESVAQAGERLLNALVLQRELSREDTVFQVPFLMNDKMQNLQLYVMNRRKSKKIDPSDMTLLMNFDTQYLGNLNVFMGVKNLKVTMKIGVARQEDKEWIDARRQQLAELLAAAGYEMKELTYRVEEEQHLMTLAAEMQMTGGYRRSRLDLRI